MRENSAALGDCLMTLIHGPIATADEYVDARAAAIRLGEFVNAVCGALKKG